MTKRKDPIDYAFDTEGVIEAALQEAVREALIVHKRMGNPIAAWHDGRVILVPPEEIDVTVSGTKARRRKARRRARKTKSM